jgi:hypothetical protein
MSSFIKDAALTATSFILSGGESIPIVGQIFNFIQEIMNMVDAANKNDKKAQIDRDTINM